MRKLMRSVARGIMAAAGIQRMNKKTKPMYGPDGKPKGKTSYFALHWRAYLTPGSGEWKQARKGMAAR